MPSFLQSTVPNFRRKRLAAVRLARSDDALFNLAMRKARELIMYKPEDTQMGLAAFTNAGSLMAEQDVWKVLNDSLYKGCRDLCETVE